MEKVNVTTTRGEGWDGVNITIPSGVTAVTPDGKTLGPGSHRVELAHGHGIIVLGRNSSLLVTVDDCGWINVFEPTPLYRMHDIKLRVITQGDTADSQFVLTELPEGVRVIAGGREYTKTAQIPVGEWFTIWRNSQFHLAIVNRKTVTDDDGSGDKSKLAIEFLEPEIWETQWFDK